MAPKEIICSVCGAKNPPNATRCASCGAKLDAFGGADYTDEELAARKNQQDTFEWKWVIISFVINTVLQAIVLVGLPFALPFYDPEGMAGIFISIGLWFVGGTIVGALSPGKTFYEPAVGTLASVPGTILYLATVTTVYKASPLAYVVGGLIGVGVALFGAFLGEKIQGDKKRK